MKIKVGVFFGGKSVEHEVSIISALQAISAIDTEKYEAIPVYIAKDHKMYTGEALVQIENYQNINTLLESCKQIALINDNGVVKMIGYPASWFAKKPLDHIDVALPVVHGANVEDGTLQGFFETLSLPYAGCDLLSSALAMDKYATKAILKSRGLPVLDCCTIEYSQFVQNKEKTLDEIEQECSYPMIVKPVNLGSSIGISKAASKDEVRNAVEYAFEFSNRVLIENAVVNLREINCSVLGDCENAEASVCEEPVNNEAILSYADKYLNGSKMDKAGMASLKRIIPAPISDEITKNIQNIAIQSFKALGCGGVVRIDFLMDQESGSIYVNEVNPIPGSLSFYLWEATGKKYPALIDELVKLALKREREKKKIKHSFETNILSNFISGQGKNGKYGGAKN